MYNNIIDPVSNNVYSIYSRKGRKIIKNFLDYS